MNRRISLSFVILTGCVFGCVHVKPPESVPVGKAQTSSAIVLPADVGELKAWIEGYLRTNGCDLRASAVLPNNADEYGWWAYRQYKAEPLDRHALFQLLAGHLELGRQMLAETGEMRRRQGLGIILQAERAVLGTLKDNLLAVAICEGWILPNLDVASASDPDWLGKKNMLNHVEYAYAAAKDKGRREKLHKLVIVHLTGRNDTDWARYRLSLMAEERGDLKQALEYLQGIDATNTNGMFPARSRIPELEQKIRAQSSR